MQCAESDTCDRAPENMAYSEDKRCRSSVSANSKQGQSTKAVTEKAQSSIIPQPVVQFTITSWCSSKISILVALHLTKLNSYVFHVIA